MINNERNNKNFYFFLAAILLIAADQLIKFAIKGFPWSGSNHSGMMLGQSISVIGDTVQLTFVENEGMAFGITFGPAKIFLSLFSIFAGIALAWYLQKIKQFSAWVRLGIMFIFAGAVGNLIDRVFYGVIYNYAPIFYGRVVDFFQVDIPDINIWRIHYTHFPVFNLADSCVTVGVVFLLIFHKRIPTIKDITTKEHNFVTTEDLKSSETT